MMSLNNPSFEGSSVLASIIVPCKGRLHHLRRTLPNMLAQECEFSYEVIIVDYSCPQGTYDWCRDLDVRNLTVLKVLDAADTFNHSRARNCGANAAAGSVLAFVDADVRLESDWLQRATRPIRAGRADLVTVSSGGGKGCQCMGTCAISVDLYRDIRGYDEALQGWNSEDTDLYARAERRATRAHYASGLVTPIEHGNDERARFQVEKNVCVSNTNNQSYLSGRMGIVNPNGYGQGNFVIFRGSGDRLPPIVWLRRERIVRPIRRAAGGIEKLRRNATSLVVPPLGSALAQFPPESGTTSAW
jgi:glycosyltransferase involved in cell wall biosynthesis